MAHIRNMTAGGRTVEGLELGRGDLEGPLAIDAPDLEQGSPMGVRILLAATCLSCPHLSVLDETSAFYESDGRAPHLTVGSITCSHLDVCKRIDGEPSVSEIIGYEHVGGGE